MSERTPASRHLNIIVFSLLLAAVAIISFQMIKPYLLAIFMGGIIALLCRPLYLKIAGKHTKSTFASSVVTLLLILSILTPCTLLGFLSVKQGMKVVHGVSEDDEFTFESVTQKVVDFPLVRNFVDDPKALQEQIKVQTKATAKTLSAAMLASLSNIPELILQFVLTFISCFFLLIDGPKLVVWLRKKIPLEPETRTKLATTFKDTTVSTIFATLAAAGAQAALMFFSFLILGVPAAFLAGGATFIFAWIPMIGSLPVWVVGAIYLAVQGASLKVVLMIVLGLFTGIIDNFIRPMVLKGRSEMHPLVSLVAIFGGIQMFGILGVFVGPIIAAILISLVDVIPTVARD